MSLAAGTRLGPYEILSPLGAGGMGEVYRARDERLKRDVAIKILPEAFAADPERLARFQREAQVLASLNHPGIAAIYGFEEADGVRALVLEIVEGETLADRIARGPMPLEEALEVAREIALALEAAHERGIVHRDLKPANVKLTPEGRVKVLDFGLAKALTGDGSSPDVTSSPTMTAAATQAGVVIGTAAYMSPEQARGKSVDRRADIWAFGALVYEMLAGRKAFEGETVSDTLAAVLRSEPDWTRLPPSTPGHVRRTLKRCLERDRDRRLHDIGDVRLELEDPGVGEPDAASRPDDRSSLSRWAPWALAALFAAAAVWLALRSVRVGPVAPRPPRLFSISGVPVAFDQRQSLAISPDGAQVVYRGRSEEGEERLFVREPGALVPRVIPGTNAGGSPFFSPDGRSIGFTVADALLRVDLSGGTPQKLADLGHSFFGGVWDSDGSILFTSEITGGSIARVPAGGGKPEIVVAVDPARVEDRLFTPWPLPGGNGLLFTSRRGGQGSQLRVEAASLPNGERHVIAEDGSSPLYRDGLVFFQQGGIVMAVAFDIAKMRVTGTPIPVLDSVRHRISGSVRNFNVSENGTLAYMPAPSTEGARLVWLDRKGVETGIAILGNVADSPRLSPDGQRVLFRVPAPNCDVWMHDLARGSTLRLTTEGDNHGAIWSPDGRRILFARVRSNQAELISVDSGGGSPETLFTGGLANAWTSSSTPDGRSVALNTAGPETSGDVVLIEGGKARHAVASRFDDGAGAISPNGRHLAYVSTESGRSEIYVQPLSGGGERIQVSAEGGREPVWSRDGREIFFRHGRQMLAAAVESSTPFRTGRPHVLFEHDLTIMTGPSVPNYDVSRDGRFLMIRTTGAAATESYVVLDWLPDVKRRLAPSASR